MKPPNPQHRGLLAGRNIKVSPGKIIHRWAFWPQQLARNEVRHMRKESRGLGLLSTIASCADALAKRTKKRRDQVIVFYPQRYAKVVRDNLAYHLNRSGRAAEFRGLVFSGTKRLRGKCVAFLISDVEKHKTPADAYHVIREHRAMKPINPKPLYSGREKGTGGMEIHE